MGLESFEPGVISLNFPHIIIYFPDKIIYSQDLVVKLKQKYILWKTESETFLTFI